GLICILDDPIDKEVINAGKKLQIISNYAVGYNNIDVEEATKKEIIVTNTPGVLTDATADLTWALIMGITRRLIEGKECIRNGEFIGWGAMLLLGTELRGKKLGIIGAGRIGQAVTKRALGFGMKIIYYSRTANKEIEQMGAELKDLDELIQEADIISLHIPLTPETNKLITRERIAQMKKTAYLINTSRGQVIDEEALIEALEKKEIRGAALDVFEKEPEVPQKMLELSNIVITPHIGSATEETRTKMSEMVAENIIASFSNQQPPNRVN
ncbi:MAG: D-glycerate dehydrogenase, partial [Candidatus Heimdallarchaeota archaeon]|nr:D-glycerate dehydrogenase [Candidatus Heimdallarchaeota archaeon]MCK5049401.1 D-glycerate dehydrogenase [Candidatus Heimdallarchaeota archaeon]